MPLLDPVFRVHEAMAPDEQPRRSRPSHPGRPFLLLPDGEALDEVPHIVPRMAYVAAGTGAAIACLSRAAAGYVAET